MMAYELKSIAILNVKGDDYKCVTLNNFELGEKGSL